MKTPDFDILLGEYLQVRRSLGFKLKRVESQLRGFVAFLKQQGASRITGALAARFAGGVEGAGERMLVTKKNYLCAIRAFAHYLSGAGFPAEAPPPGLPGRRPERPRPYIYTHEEVARLLALALSIPSAKAHAGRYGLKPWTLHTLIGLLAATGMRLGEALSLRHEDIDWNEGVIRIGNAKFLKSRLVPVHPTTLEKLRSYARRLECFFATRNRRAQPWFFVTCNGRALTPRQTCHDFHKLLHRAGLRKRGERRGPRLHDLRHRFAVVTLLRHHESGNVMPVLATYLGHSHARHTYWYLSSTPGLMAAAKERLEKRWEGGAK